MGDRQRAKPAGYLAGWIIVLLSTLISCACATASLGLIWEWGELPSFVEFAHAVLKGSILMGALAGIVSATICGFMVRHTPPGRIVLPILIPSVVVGVLTAPIFVLGSAVCIVMTQVLVAGVLGGRDEPPRRGDPTRCAACRYSLDGLDRATSPVCPECGRRLG